MESQSLQRSRRMSWWRLPIVLKAVRISIFTCQKSPTEWWWCEPYNSADVSVSKMSDGPLVAQSKQDIEKSWKSNASHTRSRLQMGNENDKSKLFYKFNDFTMPNLCPTNCGHDMKLNFWHESASFPVSSFSYLRCRWLLDAEGIPNKLQMRFELSFWQWPAKTLRFVSSFFYHEDRHQTPTDKCLRGSCPLLAAVPLVPVEISCVLTDAIQLPYSWCHSRSVVFWQMPAGTIACKPFFWESGFSFLSVRQDCRSKFARLWKICTRPKDTVTWVCVGNRANKKNQGRESFPASVRLA